MRCFQLAMLSENKNALRENISEILFIMRRWLSRSKLGQILSANCSDSDSGGQFYSNVPKFSQSFSAIFWDTVSGVEDSTQIFQYLVKYSVQYFQTQTVGWTILLKYSNIYSNIQWNIFRHWQWGGRFYSASATKKRARHCSNQHHPTLYQHQQVIMSVLINIIAMDDRYSLSVSVEWPHQHDYHYQHDDHGKHDQYQQDNHYDYYHNIIIFIEY